MAYAPIATVTAVAATMSSTVAPRLRSQTGRLKPCKNGPTACAPANSCANLYAILPASRFGKISTFASPSPMPFLAAMRGLSAASACTGPIKPVASAASRTRSTLAPAPLAPVEKESIATRAEPRSASADFAEAIAIAANSSAEGSTFTAQSANTISRPSGNTIRKNDDGIETPSCKPKAIEAASITFFVGLSAPATIASASPAATIAAARKSGRSSIRRAIPSFSPRAATSAATCASLTGASAMGSAKPSAASRAMASATRGSSASGNTTRAFSAFAVTNAVSSTDFCEWPMGSSLGLERRQA